MKISELVSKLDRPIPDKKGGFFAFCPSHGDGQKNNRRSLNVVERENKLLFHCFAGCRNEDIIEALGLEMSDLFIDKPRSNGREIASIFDYTDKNGKLSYQVVKYFPKDFRQRRPDGKGGWLWDMKGVNPLPYRLPDLLAAFERKETVFIVEGEKDADNMAKIGLVATTNHGGAGKWRQSHSEYFPVGAEVIVLQDNDQPGRDHAQKVAASLTARGCSARTVELPGLPEKGDVSDWLAAGHGKKELTDLINKPEDKPEEWEKPVPFNEYDLPPFRHDVFPGWLREFILAESESSQTPPDLTGMLVLTVCAAAVAKKVNVKIRGGWTEPLNLFTVTALPPASRKSAVFADVLEPVVEYEEELTRDILPLIEDKRTKRKILEHTLSRVQLEASKAKGFERNKLTEEAIELGRELAETPVKALPRLVVDDCSPEKLANIMSDQGGRIGVFAPEGDVFDIMGGRYSSGTPNLGVYLRGHAGDTIRIDRVGRAPEFIKNPALTFGVCVQPEVLQGLIHKPSFRGRGLLGRFLYSLPRPNIGSRRIGSEPMPAEIISVYKKNIKKLYSLPGRKDEQGELIPYSLHLSAEAQLILNDFEQWIEPQLGELGTLGSIQDWAGKLAGAVVRIAGIIHMAANVDRPAPWEEPIQKESLSCAVMLSDYLISHARAAYDEMGGNQEFDAAKHILKWITKSGLLHFTKREAHYSLQGRFKKADELDPALTVLMERGYIREIVEKKSGPGRKPSPAFEANPAVF